MPITSGKHSSTALQLLEFNIWIALILDSAYGICTASRYLPEAYKDCTTIGELNKRLNHLEGVWPKTEPRIFDASTTFKL
jgi:hypothetical protein